MYLENNIKGFLSPVIVVNVSCSMLLLVIEIIFIKDTNKYDTNK